MKKIDIKQIYINKFYWNFCLIGISIFAYVFIVLIFRAGYDYQRVIQIREKEPKEKFKDYSYEIKLNNQEFKTKKFSSEKNLFSLLDSIEEVLISYTSFYEGYEIISINNNSNFKILLNGQEITNRFFTENDSLIPEKSEIVIYF
jgi:hypothetical protein